MEIFYKADSTKDDFIKLRKETKETVNMLKRASMSLESNFDRLPIEKISETVSTIKSLTKSLEEKLNKYKEKLLANKV